MTDKELLVNIYDVLDDALLPDKFRPIGFREEVINIREIIKKKNLHI